MHCIVSCWILREHGDREWVSNRWTGLIKAWYIQTWSAKVKLPWTINTHFKKKKKGEKKGLFHGQVPVGDEWAQGNGKWGWIRWMHFVFMYENRMKTVEIVLRRWRCGEERRSRTISYNLTNIYSNHICKHHNVFPCTTIIY
jgi:hypothetical protein